MIFHTKQATKNKHKSCGSIVNPTYHRLVQLTGYSQKRAEVYVDELTTYTITLNNCGKTHIAFSQRVQNKLTHIKGLIPTKYFFLI